MPAAAVNHATVDQTALQLLLLLQLPGFDLPAPRACAACIASRAPAA
jgi:hypothetical protein